MKAYTIKLHHLTDHFDAETSEKLRHLAEKHDASVIMDRDGDVAILRRHYDSEGVQQVRYAPDPCNFRPATWWLNAADEQAERAVC